MYLVFFVYTALMRQMQHDRAICWTHIRLTTIDESFWLFVRETLAKTIAWAIERTQEGRP
jgi:hypothetical protein